MNYLDLLRKGEYKDHEGRHITLRRNSPVTIYIAADFTEELRQDIRDTALTEMPDGESYFMTKDNIYLEVISYNKLLSGAKMRNRPFFRVLGLSTHNRED